MDTCFNELTSQTDSGRILQIALSENKTITAKGPAQMYIEQIRVSNNLFFIKRVNDTAHTNKSGNTTRIVEISKLNF